MQFMLSEKGSSSMATLSVWEFPTADGADQAIGTLESLQKQQLITIHDAAIVTWPADKKKPKTRQLNQLAGAGAMTGAFWGLLFGLLFFIPIFGLAVGAAMGALAGSMADVGIDDDFIKRVRSEVTPGTSALFVLTSGAVVDRVRDAFKDRNMTLLTTNLTKEQEDKLRETFAEEGSESERQPQTI
jgi:uncharacterized membrane protein